LFTDPIRRTRWAKELNWESDIGGGFKAKIARGAYRVFDTAIIGYGGISASFTPAQGRARLPKNREPLGNVATFREAKMICERHHNEKANLERAKA